jgi:putative transposase
LSDGSVLQNIHISPKESSRMKRLQRVISRRKKGSRNRRKAILKFARKYEHISRIKDDHLHKLSHTLVNSYSFIAYEELQIANMMGNHRLARSIGEESWGKFTDYLRYKAESAGCVVVSVDPRNTSKTCSSCGNVQDMPLSKRTFHCKECGMSKDRDLNAAVNVLNRATSGHGGSYASGDSARPSARKAVVRERGTTLGDSR